MGTHPRSFQRISRTTLILGLLAGLLMPPASLSVAATTRTPSSLARKPSQPERPPAGLLEALAWRLARPPFRGAKVGAVVISLEGGNTLFESKADQPLMPASTMKILTSGAALDALGPDWRYATRFAAAAPPENGVIAGDLFVFGSCEPDLVVEAFPAIGAELVAAGIREVHGDVVADLSYFDGEERPPDWPGAGNPNPYAAPISALAANFSSVRVSVQPGPSPGAPARVFIEPPSDVVQVQGSVLTIAKGAAAVRATRKLVRGPDGEIRNRILVSGRIPRTFSVWQSFVPIENPSSVAAGAVRRALIDAGIVVRGDSRIGTAPEGSVVVATHASRTLTEIVRDMNKNSNNFMAEMLQRTLGGETIGVPASREKGARAVGAFLRTCGVDPDPLTLSDGSGLSRGNRVSARALARVLVRMRSDPALAGAFYESLPIGGIDGTLRGRMVGPSRGCIHAKTGHIDGATTLAGYVDDTTLGPIAFAFLVNQADHGRALRGLDDLTDILCRP